MGISNIIVLNDNFQFTRALNEVYHKENVEEMRREPVLDIKQATKNDISIIEDIFFDVIRWMDEKDISNKWNSENIKWKNLKKDYKISDFFILYYNKYPAGCIAITDEDRTYFSNCKKGENIFLHKMAVKRNYAGNDLSRYLIDYAKKYAVENNKKSIKLDCNMKREKLRELYEKNGFVLVGEYDCGNNYIMALYSYDLL